MQTETVINYANRKLYRKGEGVYTNLKELRDLLRQGTNIRFVCGKTREDITQKKLISMIFFLSQEDMETKSIEELYEICKKTTGTGEGHVAKARKRRAQIRQTLEEKGFYVHPVSSARQV